MKALLLCYYPDYRFRAEREARKLLKIMGSKRTSDLIIISNNIKSRLESDIIGPDPSSEFAGWAEGLRTLKIGREPILFLNDTFCHHHRWSAVDRFRIKSRLTTGSALDPMLLLGEVNKGVEPLSLYGKPVPYWVSTYLFCLGPDLLSSIKDRFEIPDYVVKKVLVSVKNGNIIWAPSVDPRLSDHLEKWLKPGSHVHWHAAGKVSDEVLFSKIKSILNEFWISALCIEAGANIAKFSTTADSLKKIKNAAVRRLKSD